MTDSCRHGRNWIAWRHETQRLNNLHHTTSRRRWLRRRRILREFRGWGEWGIREATENLRKKYGDEE